MLVSSVLVALLAAISCSPTEWEYEGNADIVSGSSHGHIKIVFNDAVGSSGVMLYAGNPAGYYIIPGDVVVQDNTATLDLTPVPMWDDTIILRVIIDNQIVGTDKQIPLSNLTTFADNVTTPMSISFEPAIVHLNDKVTFRIKFYPEANQQGSPMLTLNNKYELQYISGVGCLFLDWVTGEYSGPTVTITNDNTFDIVLKGQYGIVFSGVFDISGASSDYPEPKAVDFEPKQVKQYDNVNFVIHLYEDEEKTKEIKIDTRNYTIKGQYDGSCLLWDNTIQAYTSKYIKIYDYNYFIIGHKQLPDVALRGYYTVLPGTKPQRPMPYCVTFDPSEVTYDVPTTITFKMYKDKDNKCSGEMITQEESGNFQFSCGINAVWMKFNSATNEWVAENVRIQQPEFSIFSEFYIASMYNGNLTVSARKGDNLNRSLKYISWWVPVVEGDPNGNPPGYCDDGTHNPSNCYTTEDMYIAIAIYKDDDLQVHEEYEECGMVGEYYMSLIKMKVTEPYNGEYKSILKYMEWDPEYKVPKPYYSDKTPALGAFVTSNPVKKNGDWKTRNTVFITDTEMGSVQTFLLEDDFFTAEVPKNLGDLKDKFYYIESKVSQVVITESGNPVVCNNFLFSVGIYDDEDRTRASPNHTVFIKANNTIVKTQWSAPSVAANADDTTESGVYVATSPITITNLETWDGEVELIVDDTAGPVPVGLDYTPSQPYNKDPVDPIDPGVPVVPPPHVDPPNPKTLTDGQIAGIVIGCILVVALIVIVVLIVTGVIKTPCIKRGKKEKVDKEENKREEAPTVSEKSDTSDGIDRMPSTTTERKVDTDNGKSDTSDE